MMPQGDRDKNDNFNTEMAVKVTKGQICRGSIAKKIMSQGVQLIWKVS